MHPVLYRGGDPQSTGGFRTWYARCPPQRLGGAWSTTRLAPRHRRYRHAFAVSSDGRVWYDPRCIQGALRVCTRSACVRPWQSLPQTTVER